MKKNWKKIFCNTYFYITIFIKSFLYFSTVIFSVFLINSTISEFSTCQGELCIKNNAFFLEKIFLQCLLLYNFFSKNFSLFFYCNFSEIFFLLFFDGFTYKSSVFYGKIIVSNCAPQNSLFDRGSSHRGVTVGGMG